MFSKIVLKPSSATILTMSLTAALYIFAAFVYLPSKFYWSPDNGYKRLQADNIRLEPLLDLHIEYLGLDIDPDFKFIPFPKIFYFVQDRQLFLSQTPVISLLSKPFIALWGDYGEKIVPLLAGWITIYLVGAITELAGLGPKWAGILITGLATPVLIFSQLLWEHTLVTALAAAAVLLILKPTRANMILAGVLSGFCFVARKEMIFFDAAIGIVLLMRLTKTEWWHPHAWRFLIGWGKGAAVVVAIYELTVYLQTGYWIPPELRVNTPPEFSSQSFLLVNGAIRTVSIFLFDEQYGALGIALTTVVAIYCLANLIQHSRMRYTIQCLALALVGVGVAFFTWGMWFDYKLYGILGVSPFILLAFTRHESDSSEAKHYKQEITLLIVCYFVLAMLGRSLFKKDEVPSIGPEWGLRYFLIVFVFAVPLVVGTLRRYIEEAKQSSLAAWFQSLGILLIALSVLIEIMGLRVIYNTSVVYLERAKVLREVRRDTILTDDPWLTSNAPEIFVNKPVFLAETPEALRDWIQSAYSKGIRRFNFVSHSLYNDDLLRSIAPTGLQLARQRAIQVGKDWFSTELQIAPTGSVYSTRQIVSGLSHPVYLTYADDGSQRLFVVEQEGRIRVVQDGKLLLDPFLDITNRAGKTDFKDVLDQEVGLLGLAFHPNYKQNGLFWVYYVVNNRDVIVARYSVSSNPNRADPSSEQIILHISAGQNVHKGGQLLFGHDGYLYIGIGDGGPQGDPENHGQRLDTLRGKILRLDVSTTPYNIPPDNPFINTPNARPEIWTYGLRNPWRFSFDRITHDLYIGDPGYNSFEEVDFLPAGISGANFGWNLYEGAHPFKVTDPTLAPKVTPPIAEFANGKNFCAMIGGYVYRGSNLRTLQGTYLFGDFCSGDVWTLKRDPLGNWQSPESLALQVNAINISSWGEDQDGELYLLDHYSGSVYKLISKQP